MSNKIYTLLLRLYPSPFRKEYEAEILRLFRERHRDEKGFFKRVRLWWDLLLDLFAALLPAYRNSYAINDPAPLTSLAAGIPAFRGLDEEHLGRWAILSGSTIALLVLAAFASLLGAPTVRRPIPGSNGRLSPIEAVMQRLNENQSPDPAASSCPGTSSGASAPMSEPHVKASTPAFTSSKVSAPSSKTGIMMRGERSRNVSGQTESSGGPLFNREDDPQSASSSSKNKNQTDLSDTQHRAARLPIPDVQNGGPDPQPFGRQSQKYIGTVEKRTPIVVLSYTPANPVPGSTVSLTAKVLGLGSNPAPTGNVGFFDGSAALDLAKLSNGTVTIKVKLRTAASHSLSAIYYGDDKYDSRSSMEDRK